MKPHHRKSQPLKKQRTRPDVYTQALHAATKRLAQAIKEQVNCETQLAQLNEEIPRLQAIIAVLEPQKESAAVMETPSALVRDEVQIEQVVETKHVAPKASPQAMALVPDHLKRFMGPKTQPVQVTAEADLNSFLEDVE